MHRMLDAKTQHAKAQREYAAKLKKKGIPTSDDLARAMLAAVRKGYRDVKSSRAEAKRAMGPLIAAAVDHLVARGFDRKETTDRLARTIFRKNANHCHFISLLIDP